MMMDLSHTNKEVSQRLKAFYSGKISAHENPMPKKLLRILILEDQLEILSVIMTALRSLESKDVGIAFSVFSESTHVDEFVNRVAMDIDVVLLDRDCCTSGSFHVLDFEKIGVEKIIAISAIHQWNEEAARRGVTHIVQKNLTDLPQFAHDILKHITKIISDATDDNLSCDYKTLWLNQITDKKGGA